MSKPRLLDAYTKKSKMITSTNADFAEVGEWSDGNPSSEDRIGYFVSVDSTSPGKTMIKSNHLSEVRGVTMSDPGFSATASPEKYDESGVLLPKYAYVGFIGMIPVIDNGTCTVNSRCMPSDTGTATPSDSNYGYLVIERIDATHVLVLIEPQGDVIQRIDAKISEQTAVVEGTKLILSSSRYTVEGKKLIIS